MDRRSTVLRLIRHITRQVYDAWRELKFTPGMSLFQIETEYRATLINIMTSYMDGSGPVTAFRNEMNRAANDAMTLAGYAGWADGGGSGAPSAEVMSWIAARVSSEMAYISEVFEKLKDLRKNGTTEEQRAFIAARAEGYTASLQGVYNYAFMQGGANILGVWRRGPTLEYCDTCAWLESLGPMPLSWFAANDYIPRQAGSKTLKCGGWECLCGIYDPLTGKQLL